MTTSNYWARREELGVWHPITQLQAGQLFLFLYIVLLVKTFFF